ncbi:MAG TPA: DUF1800 domain-containing protein [Vicinamibacterales bacterium]|jgi:uncharacterized protein (DUF1800 family)|nr:DUF1800 domain-containing protein [Vicinamibacterales bacterium]
MSQLDPAIDHLLRRAGFGASAADVETFRDMSLTAAVAHLVDYAGRPDDVDERIGRPDHVQVSTNNLFAPDIDIDDARQRWMFRMVHSRRPLQEKLAMFWHNHFATAFSKLANDSGTKQAAKLLAAKPGSLRGPMGQIELFREYGMGSYRDLLFRVSQDAATVIWLDGQFNTKTRPQENFGREIMELFSVGVGNYTEPDVYAAARVFSGWNLRESEGYSDNDMNAYKEFVYNADQHETSEKTFSFPIYSDGSKTIPVRSESAGMQDGIDLITALAFHPETARRLARKFWNFFVSEIVPPHPAFVTATANVYLQSGTRIGPVVYSVLTSPWFNDPTAVYARYSWPAEFVVRSIKEVGWQNFSVDKARAPMSNMGQALYEPPNVGGWPLGAGWFSTSTMLARSNFAATLASSQKGFLAAQLQSQANSPQALMAAMLDRITPAPFDSMPQQALVNYLVAGGAWNGSESQVSTRAAGLARLLVASSEYQLV